MKSTYQLKNSPSIALTPQLQQAIRLLQLSQEELDQEIQTFLKNNIMLEAEEFNQNTESMESQENKEDEITTINNLYSKNSFDENLHFDSIEQPLTIQSTADYFDPITPEFYFGLESPLHSHLVWQLQASNLSDKERLIAFALIDAIDERGFLTSSISQIQDTLASWFKDITTEEIETVLTFIQQFEPAGVAARNLKECLLLQLKQMPTNTPHLNKAINLVENHFDLLTQHHYRQIQLKCHFSRDVLHEILMLLRKLNFYPGNILSEKYASITIIPDVILKKVQDKWEIHINENALPHLYINQQYADLINNQRKATSDVRYLKQQLQEAKWFLKSLQSRNETLLQVANFIANFQKDFFEMGEQFMKPLKLQSIAENLGLHESTISRITMNKFIATPCGVLPLKFFFSSHLSSENGDDYSSVAVRARIKKIVQEENPEKPYSDQKISDILKREGIQVARRTIAKYRESLNIPSAHDRKLI